MIHPDEYTVRLSDDLPLTTGGFVSESPDGHLNVYINARLSHAAQLDAVEHELEHIEDDDLHNARDIREVEREADAGTRGALPRMMRARDLPRPRKYRPPVRRVDDIAFRWTALDDYKEWMDLPERRPLRIKRPRRASG